MRILAATRYFLATLVVVAGAFLLVTACQRHTSSVVASHHEIPFPLDPQIFWVYEAATMDGRQWIDTLRIDQTNKHKGERFYHLSGLWIELWVVPDTDGNLFWTNQPGDEKRPFLLFDAQAGESWSSGLGPDVCGGSWIVDDYAVVETPHGLYDGALDITISSACLDHGTGVTVAPGIGPVRWRTVGLAGITNWLLVDTNVELEIPNKPGSDRIVDSR